jgi:prolyl-tRNA synthetase
MKDLYTFDSSVEAALDTYQQVRAAYNGLFTELGIPFLTAEADSGGMGGKLSHEYHLESPLGEDIVWNCDKCNYAANDEVVEARQCDSATESWRAIKTWRSISKDRSRHIVVVYPAQYQATEAAVEDLDQKILKEVYPDIDFSIDCPDTLDTTPANQTKSVTFIFDPRISAEEYFVSKTPTGQNTVTIVRADCRLTAIQSGDLCPRCPNGHLTPHRTIEVGHTFHLGTRYSEPLDVTAMPATPGEPPVPVQMGCHGIGVSRLIGAMASILASPTGQRMPAFGLRWPLAIAPYHVLVISLDQNLNPVAEEVYDCLANLSSVATQGKIDVLLDDRDKPVASRLYEADLVGYPIVTIVGRAWTRSKKVEVYCRKTGQRKEVMLHELERIVRVMLSESELGLD